MENKTIEERINAFAEFNYPCGKDEFKNAMKFIAEEQKDKTMEDAYLALRHLIVVMEKKPFPSYADFINEMKKL